MGKRKIAILILSFILVSIFVIMVDTSIRYNIGIYEYYNYNKPFSEIESELIREKPLIVGVYNDPPLTYTNEYNNYNTGIVIDYLSQLAIETRSNMLLKVGSEDSLKESLTNDEIDIRVTDDTKENDNSIITSQPLCIVKSKILVKSNSQVKTIGDLKGQTIVTLAKDNKDGKISNFLQNFEIETMEVDNIYQCFALLDKDNVAGFAGDDMEATHFLNVTNRSTKFRFLDPVIYERKISLSVNKEDTNLLRVLNKGILELKKKNLIAQTQYKWLGDFKTDAIDIKSIELAYRISMGAILLIGFFLSWNYVITQRVNTRTRELSESKEELRLIIDTMQSGIMVIQDQFTIIGCNNSIIRMTNTSRENLIGYDYNNIKELEPFINENNINKIVNIDNEYYYITQQKITKNKRMLVVEDYTQKHLDEKKARQETKMIAVGQLSAGLAHEIRNPLGLIKSYSYILENHKLNDICNHAVSVINDSVNRINNLIENLLRFSKLSNDEIKLVNIEKFLYSIVELEKNNLDQKEVKLVINYEGDKNTEVLINEDVLRMVVLNLINNSVDSFQGLNNPNKIINLSVKVVGENLKVKISDNGSGIEPSIIENIFDPFYSTKEKGTGLGLYILSTEINNNNGKITVESSEKSGTSFHVELPIKRRLI